MLREKTPLPSVLPFRERYSKLSETKNQKIKKKFYEVCERLLRRFFLYLYYYGGFAVFLYKELIIFYFKFSR